MIRVKATSIHFKKAKKYSKLTKGYTKANGNLFRYMKEQITQSFNAQYIGRKQKKRISRANVISELSSSVRILPLNYSSFIGRLRQKYVLLNRNILGFIGKFDMRIIEVISNRLLAA